MAELFLEELDYKVAPTKFKYSNLVLVENVAVVLQAIVVHGVALIP